MLDTTFEPARVMALLHALITALVAGGVLLAGDVRVQAALVVLGVVGDWLAGRVVRDRVSPTAKLDADDALEAWHTRRPGGDVVSVDDAFRPGPP